VARIEEYILSGRTHQIATANLDFARNSLSSPTLQRVICECSLVLPDGAPMLWASRLFGRPLKERVTGCDLIPELARLSAEKGYRIFLLGSNDRNTAQAALILQRAFPGVQIVGRYSPPVTPLEEMDNAVILQQLAETQPDILLVAFGNPKQEMWISQHRDQLNVPVAIGIGGSLEMISGSVRRAPKWVQDCHMEFLFRMTQEPMRLFPRYFHDGLALLRHLPAGLLMHRLQRRPARTQLRAAVEVTWPARIVSMPEALTGDTCAFLISEAHAATRERQMLVVDLTATSRIEADGLGCLLECRRLMHAPGLSIWLTGLSNNLRMFLQASAVIDLFFLAGTAADIVRLANIGGNYERRAIGSVRTLPAFERRHVEQAS
jgi:N-acetylglucosaminyldiphosphoundecaprenol N-acetyl-beta-D-mannosaminyltransferase